MTARVCASRLPGPTTSPPASSGTWPEVQTRRCPAGTTATWLYPAGRGRSGGVMSSRSAMAKSYLAPAVTLAEPRQVQAGQPLGVGEDVDRRDPAVAHREAGHGDRDAVAQGDRSGHAVDEGGPPLARAAAGEHERLAGHLLGAADAA